MDEIDPQALQFKEVCAYYGAAMYMAQVIEHGKVDPTDAETTSTILTPTSSSLSLRKPFSMATQSIDGSKPTA